ncbi:ABC transporter [Streptococcus dentapri]|uniref:ABC transporter n=1 Tax=Streptococcus dentapri TaxID=573564 RepID=A0ABV8D2L0_9STRE
MNVTDIIGAIDTLTDTIYKYHINGVNIQLEYLDDLRNILADNITLSERKKIAIYQSLFPPHGGLSEINYWNDNFEVRKQVNTRISNNTTILANFLLGNK